MKNLNNLVLQTMDDMTCCGIPFCRDIEWKINKRAQSRWGRCTKHSDGTFTIEISSRLLANNLDDMAAKDTIAHELIHTCDGCMNHKDTFLKYASWLNISYGYDIKRTTSASEKGIKETPKKTKYKYMVHCAACGRSWKYQKKSKIVSLIMDKSHTHGCKCPCGDTKHLMAWELKK